MNFQRPTTVDANRAEAAATALRSVGLDPSALTLMRAREAVHSQREAQTSVDSLTLDAARAAISDPEGFAADEFAARATSSRSTREVLEAVDRHLRTTPELQIAATQEAAEMLRAEVVGLAKQLTTAAKRLPITDPFDTEDVISTDAGAALRTAERVIHQLMQVVGIYPLSGSREGIPHVVTQVVELLDIPETREEVRGPGARTAASGSDMAATLAVRSLLRDASTRRDRSSLVEPLDPARLLVAVARGAYPGVAVSLAATRAEVAQRLSRLQTATIIREG